MKSPLPTSADDSAQNPIRSLVIVEPSENPLTLLDGAASPTGDAAHDVGQARNLPITRLTQLKHGGFDLPLPMSPEDCTPEWLTCMLNESYMQVLPPDGSVVVSAVKLEEVIVASSSGEGQKDGGGMSGSNLVRLHLTYSPKKPVRAPETLMFKFTNMRGSEAWLFNLIFINAGFRFEDTLRAEVSCYSNLFPSMRAAGDHITPPTYLYIFV